MYLPPDITKRDDLSGMDKLVYGVIRDIITRTQNDSPMLQTIATAVGGSTRTVTRSIKVLEDADLLDVERQPGIKQTYALPKQAKAKTQWLDTEEIMANMEAIDKTLDQIDVLSLRHPVFCSYRIITRHVEEIRKHLWRKTGRSYSIEVGRRRKAWSDECAAEVRAAENAPGPKCDCGSGKESTMLYDDGGAQVAQSCPDCTDKVKAKLKASGNGRWEPGLRIGRMKEHWSSATAEERQAIRDHIAWPD